MHSAEKSELVRQEIEAVRACARDRAERTSVRIVAGEIGLGHSTVHTFLHGASPHPRARRALVHWYRTRMGGDAVANAVRAALAGMRPRSAAPSAAYPGRDREPGGKGVRGNGIGRAGVAAGSSGR